MARKKPEKQEENRKDTRFKPGQSGNPGGRPKGSVSITRHLREALEAQDEDQARKLAAAIIEQASRGNGVALKAILDRIDGPVKEQVQHSYDLSNLTDEELDALDRITAKVAQPPGDTGGEG